MAEKKGTARPRGTDSAKVIQVIQSTALIGVGTEDDPCRLITQYWSLDGTKLAEHDPYRSGLERDEQKGNSSKSTAVAFPTLEEVSDYLNHRK